MTTGPVPESADAHTKLRRWLEQELECTVVRTVDSTWTTSSSLPNEIRIHQEAGMELVRVSAGMVVGVTPTMALLEEVNHLNIVRGFGRRVVDAGMLIMVAEMPVASLREGDLEQLISAVHCMARLDAPLLAVYGGRSAADLPAGLTPDLNRPVENLKDLFQATGTATIQELQVWLDEWADCDCWIDREDDQVIVVLDGCGIGSRYPFRLQDLRESVRDLKTQAEEPERDVLHDWDVEFD